jgi:hypothetical protein
MAVSQATRLGCGRDVDDVWEHIDRPPDAHELGCPYCTTARTDLAELSTATRQLAAADREDSTLRVPDGMLSDVLAIVRTQVRRGRTLPLLRPSPAPGDGSAPVPAPDLTVSEQLVATVVREVGDLDPDVEVRRVTIDVTPYAAGARSTGGGPGAAEPADLGIELQVTVLPGVAIPGLLDSLRRAIRSAVVTRIGTTVSRIDIDVVDLTDV